MKKQNLKSFSTIQRTVIIEGKNIPAIIYNGGYYFSNISVYSDGIVDAWGALDLEFLKKN